MTIITHLLATAAGAFIGTIGAAMLIHLGVTKLEQRGDVEIRWPTR